MNTTILILGKSHMNFDNWNTYNIKPTVSAVITVWRETLVGASIGKKSSIVNFSITIVLPNVKHL